MRFFYCGTNVGTITISGWEIIDTASRKKRRKSLMMSLMIDCGTVRVCVKDCAEVTRKQKKGHHETFEGRQVY